jgi:hypothetical protein
MARKLGRKFGIHGTKKLNRRARGARRGRNG